MIQRPQTVFLLLGAALLVAFDSLGAVWSPGVSAVAPVLTSVTYTLGVAAAVVALGAVFLYKDRARQRTVIGVGQGLALLVVLPLLAGLFVATPAEPATAVPGPYLVALMPLAAFVLLRMARRGVDRDIATVRSMDRLR